MSDFWGDVRRRAESATDAAKEKAGETATAAALSALESAMAALDRAVQVVRDRGPDYEVTVEIACGPVALSVTVPVGLGCAARGGTEILGACYVHPDGCPEAGE